VTRVERKEGKTKWRALGTTREVVVKVLKLQLQD
jgi:hypothetical protein